MDQFLYDFTFSLGRELGQSAHFIAENPPILLFFLLIVFVLVLFFDTILGGSIIENFMK